MARLLTSEECVGIARKERGTVLVELAHSDEFWLAIYRADTGKVWDVIHAAFKGPTHLEPGGGNGGSELERRKEGSRVENSKGAEQERSEERAQPEGEQRRDNPEGQ